MLATYLTSYDGEQFQLADVFGVQLTEFIKKPVDLFLTPQFPYFNTLKKCITDISGKISVRCCCANHTTGSNILASTQYGCPAIIENLYGRGKSIYISLPLFSSFLLHTYYVQDTFPLPFRTLRIALSAVLTGIRKTSVLPIPPLLPSNRPFPFLSRRGYWPSRIRSPYGDFDTSISQREIRILTKYLLTYLLGTAVPQIWYWPEPYNGAFIQRMDVDFPITHRKFWPQYHAAMKRFITQLHQYRVKCSFFFNTQFRDKAYWALYDLAAKYDRESHGGSPELSHATYCYDFFKLTPKELEKMLKYSLSYYPGFRAKIFAPPCEHINHSVLDLCHKLGFSAVSAGYYGRDNVPVKHGSDVIGNIYNIPTSLLEFLHGVSIDLYKYLFTVTKASDSLFAIFMHPYDYFERPEEIHAFWEYVQTFSDVWITDMRELLMWWKARDALRIEYSKPPHDLVITKQTADALSRFTFGRWTPQRVIKETIQITGDSCIVSV